MLQKKKQEPLMYNRRERMRALIMGLYGLSTVGANPSGLDRVERVWPCNTIGVVSQ